MSRSETCLKAAVRAAAGVAVVVLGQAGGSIAASLMPVALLGPLVYLVAVGPTLVVGLYLVATAVWDVAEGATERALERQTASPVHGAPVGGAPGGGPAAGGATDGADDADDADDAANDD